MTAPAPDLTVDTAFGDAVRRNDQTTLAAMLRADRPLSEGERRMLADYITGKYKTPRGNPRRARINPGDQRNAIVEYLERTTAASTGEGEAIANEIFNRIGVKRSTFFDWISEAKSAIEGFKSMGCDDDAAKRQFIEAVRSNESC